MESSAYRCQSFTPSKISRIPASKTMATKLQPISNHYESPLDARWYFVPYTYSRAMVLTGLGANMYIVWCVNFLADYLDWWETRPVTVATPNRWRCSRIRRYALAIIGTGSPCSILINDIITLTSSPWKNFIASRALPLLRLPPQLDDGEIGPTGVLPKTAPQPKD